MEGFQAVAERHDLALDALREQFCGLPTRQSTMTVTFQSLSNPAGSSVVTPECYDGDSRTCLAFLS